jgi:lipid II isoglutaminyl synthase (glutamine-hydrolysing)
MKLHIVHIYPNEMNTYGDRGNLLTLQKRAQWLGLEPVLHYYHAGQRFPKEADLVLGGGGQDSAQSDIQVDILRQGALLHKLCDDGVPMLMVCGTYQLFGNRFVTNTGEEIRGIGIFDVETIGGDKRMIGNVAVKTDNWGTLYGFENHSGQTMLDQTQQSLGRIVKGGGNNGQDGTEGARTNNAIGTYMHGPVLPNNPQLADWIIWVAVRRKEPGFELKQLDDSLSDQTRSNAIKRVY